MTASEWLVAAGLAGAAMMVGWPTWGWRARRRLVIGVRAGQARPQRRRARRSYPRLSPWRTVLVTAGLAAGTAALAGGPVAAVAGGAYGGLVARAVLRRRLTQVAASEHARRLDGLCALAADLRAGLPAPAAEASAVATGVSGVPASAEPRDRITRLTLAAGRLAERTGAPLAELIERIEADARAMDRASASAAAQAAGARATAWLLAGLPLGGIALGYGIGVDPLHVLLRTPIGAGCAVGAIALQFGGLAWADRLSGVSPLEA